MLIRNSLQEQIDKKDRELLEPRAQKEVELSQKLAQKQSELIQLKSKLENAEVERTIRDLFCVFKIGHELVTEVCPIMTIF